MIINPTKIIIIATAALKASHKACLEVHVYEMNGYVRFLANF